MFPPGRCLGTDGLTAVHAATVRTRRLLSPRVPLQDLPHGRRAVIVDDRGRDSTPARAGMTRPQEEGVLPLRSAMDNGGRLFDAVNIDVGFGDAGIATPDTLRGPDMLGFAGLPPVEVPTLPLPIHIAERVHAYTRTYGEGMRPNTRVKDLVDLALITRTAALDALALRQALDVTFAARATHALPAALPPPPPDWTRPYANLARELGIDPDLVSGYGLVTALLDPLLSAVAVVSARWDPTTHMWIEMEEG